MVDLIYCQFFEHAVDTPICRRVYGKNGPLNQAYPDDVMDEGHSWSTAGG